MNITSQSLIANLSTRHLLKHPLYQAWSDGSLPLETIRHYAAQYRHHVQAFPRYVSATHSMSQDLVARQELLRNLIDEEQGEENHPELWARFAEGIGVSRARQSETEALPETRDLVDTFFELARSSYAEGLGGLIAYEHQVPDVAKFKIDALKCHYNVSDERTLQFFQVHLAADVYHTDAVMKMFEALSPVDRMLAEKAAQRAAQALWRFLDGVQRTAAFAA